MAKDLTKVGLDGLTKRPPTARRETADGHVRGLYFIRQPSGAASWAFRYRSNGISRKLTLGTFPALDLKGARDAATKAAATLANGGDPAAEKQERRTAERAKAKSRALGNAGLIENVVDRFIDRHAKRKNRSWPETERILKKEVVGAWKSKRLSDIRRADIHELLDGIVDRGSPIVANRTLAAFRRLCNWAVERGIIDNSPAEGIKAPAAERSRDRVLTDDELRLVWQGCDAIAWPFGPLVKLLILTGQRRDEVGAMRWSEIDLDGRTWTLPATRTKNGRHHVVPLSEPAVAILKALPRIESKTGLVFTSTGETAVSGFSRAKDRIGEFMLTAMREGAGEPDKLELTRWTFHDLRRTAASGMARLGIAVHVVEAVLNHRSGTIKGVAAVYNRYSYDVEKRQALEAWGRCVETLISGATGNIIQFSSSKHSHGAG